ncbi:MAG: mechanosensitive ion channel family protein [Bacillota bacterium]
MLDNFVSYVYYYTGYNISGVVDMIFSIAMICIAMFVLLWLNKKLCKGIEARMTASEKGEHVNVVEWIRKIIKCLIIFFCIITALYQVQGLEQLMTSILAGSGILAIAIGLASQDAASNLISGIMVSIFKPFAVGNTIKLVGSGTIGTVEEITLRHTVLRTIENKRVIVPNSTINSETIENAHFGDSEICNYVEIGITYESDITKAKALCLEETLKNERVIDKRTPEQKLAGDPLVNVIVFRLDDSAVVLRIALWSQDAANGFAAKGEIMESIKCRFDKVEGVEMAYPHVVVVPKA